MSTNSRFSKALAAIRGKDTPGATTADIARLLDPLGYQLASFNDKTGEYTVLPKEMTLAEVKTISDTVSNIDKDGYATIANRANRFKSYARMDSSGGEGSVVLDTYADEVLNVSERTDEALTIEISDKKIAEKVRAVFEANEVIQSARQDIRAMCKWGDGAYLLLPRAGTTLVQLVQEDMDKGTVIDKPLRPEDIVLRYVSSEAYELEGVGTKVYKLKMTPQLQQGIVSGFDIRDIDEMMPHQFALMSLRNRDTFPYGTSILERMRVPFEKLGVVESLLAVTRANKMDRIAIKVPNMGVADPASMLNKLQHIKTILKSIILGSQGSRLSRNQDHALTEYLFVPKEFEVQKLSTSLDFGSTDDAEYFRDKVITASGLPKGYFLADKTDTRPGTLRQQDKRFARSCIPIGEAYCEGIKRLAVLVAFYVGADLSTLEVEVKLKRAPFLSQDFVDLYNAALDVVDKHVSLQKKLQGDKYSPSPDEIKAVLRNVDLPPNILFQEDGEKKDGPQSSKKKKGTYGSLLEAVTYD